METPLPRLLIIDDQPDTIALLLAYLNDFSIDISVASNSGEGLQKALSDKPDIIFLDVVMPGVDGLKLCKQLKLNPLTAAIPVIFLSGRVELHDKLLGFSAGCVDYITKPYSEAEVVARLTAHLSLVKRLSPANSDHNGPDIADKIIPQALQYLKDNLAEPPRVIALAHLLGTNERKLTDIFREQLGMTVYEYQAQLRIEQACQLLADSNLPVKQVAIQCGYKNAGDFSRAFRRRMGANPLDYRFNKSQPDAP